MNATEKYELWLKKAVVEEDIKKELDEIKGNQKEIDERFLNDLEFGTAGLRGIMGAGSSRMNVFTVRHATQGIAEYIKSIGEEEKGVVIAYDSRNRSREFAIEAAKVLCASNIKTYVFESLRPTPELSFALRHLGCISGINITASHNPKEYNGYKVYGDDGGQLNPNAANTVINKIKEIDIFDGVKTMDEETAKEKGLLTFVGEEIDSMYLMNVFSQSVNKDAIKEAKDFKVVYTPFHGAGNRSVQRVLRKAGIRDLLVVREQELPDGNFPTVKSPNPENREGFKLAIELAEKENADIIVGTDPDGDRLGAVVKDDKGEYIALTGNELGALLGEYILSERKRLKTLPDKPFVVKTVVTSELIRSIAKEYGVMVKEVLTGFKFIADAIKKSETDGSGETFIYGFEESNGYLSGSYARDKDAVVATLLTVEMAAKLKNEGKSVYQKLTEIYKKYQFTASGVVNAYKYGVDGPNEIKAIISGIRENPPKEVAGIKITGVRDYDKETIIRENKTFPTNQPKTNMLYFELGENGWFALRPSGTEPKFKIYLEYKGNTMEEAQETLSRITEEVRKIANV